MASNVNTISDLNKSCANGSTKCIYKHKSKKCQMKSISSAQERVNSPASKQIFDYVTSSSTVYLDCHSPNAIYLISCCRCFVQYVRETGQ